MTPRERRTLVQLRDHLAAMEVSTSLAQMAVADLLRGATEDDPAEVTREAMRDVAKAAARARGAWPLDDDRAEDELAVLIEAMEGVCQWVG